MEYTFIQRDALAFQQPVAPGHILAMCERAFGQGVLIHMVRELGGGQFNNTYLLDVYTHRVLIERRRSMHIPFQFGWPQVLLLLIGSIGLWLCLSACLGLLSPRKSLSEGEKERYYRTGLLPRRHFKVIRALSGLVLLTVAVSLLWLMILVQSYLGLTGEIKVAHIQATPIANAAHQMSVQVMLYDGNGQVTSENTYLLQGDEWMVQGDIIKFPAWLNVIGFHAGYKLTRLEGRFDDITLEDTARHTAIALNGGDDTFFQTTYMHKQWFAPFVDAAYGNAVFQAPGSFDVFATQDALIARPAG